MSSNPHMSVHYYASTDEMKVVQNKLYESIRTAVEAKKAKTDAFEKSNELLEHVILTVGNFFIENTGDKTLTGNMYGAVTIDANLTFEEKYKQMAKKLQSDVDNFSTISSRKQRKKADGDKIMQKMIKSISEKVKIDFNKTHPITLVKFTDEEFSWLVQITGGVFLNLLTNNIGGTMAAAKNLAFFPYNDSNTGNNYAVAMQDAMRFLSLCASFYCFDERSLILTEINGSRDVEGSMMMGIAVFVEFYVMILGKKTDVDIYATVMQKTNEQFLSLLHVIFFFSNGFIAKDKKIKALSKSCLAMMVTTLGMTALQKIRAALGFFEIQSLSWSADIREWFDKIITLFTDHSLEKATVLLFDFVKNDYLPRKNGRVEILYRFREEDTVIGKKTD